MSADLHKIRDSRLFKKLPERAFQKVLKVLKVRAFSKGDPILQLDSPDESSRSFGYVVSGRVLFLASGDKPVGLATKDEFFLGRAFEIEDLPVQKLISAAENTLVIFIPAAVIESLTTVSDSYADMVDEIYDSIFERAKMMAADAKGAQHYQDWMKNLDSGQTLSTWIGGLEKKRAALLQQKKKEKRYSRFVVFLWILGAVISLPLALESLGRQFQKPWGFVHWFTGQIGAYDPGEDYNVWLGIIGYSLVVLTNVHYLSKFLIRKFHWKIDYRLSVQLHAFMGMMGAIFCLFHTAGHVEGSNVAHLALYCLGVATLSGIVGQLIAMQIPKTLMGEKMKLTELQSEQTKLKQKAELLMNNQQYRTSVDLIARPLPQSFWLNLLSTPRLWWRRRKVKKALQALGLGPDAALLGADLVLREFRLRQKIRSLEAANVIFRRWMWIHKPFAFGVYGFGLIHILIVTLLA